MISTSCFVSRFLSRSGITEFFIFTQALCLQYQKFTKKNSPVYSWDCGLFSATFFPSDSVQVSVDSSWLFSLQSFFADVFITTFLKFAWNACFFFTRIFFSADLVVLSSSSASFSCYSILMEMSFLIWRVDAVRPSVRLVYSSTANWIYQSIWPAFLLKIAGVSMALSVHCENVRKFTNAIIQGIRLLGNDMTTIYSEEWWHTAHCIIAVVKLIDLLQMESRIYLNCHNGYWIAKKNVGL